MNVKEIYEQGKILIIMNRFLEKARWYASNKVNRTS